MKFAIATDLARLTSDETIEDNLAHVVEIVKLSEELGFEMAFVGEHHGHEYTIGPNPFSLLTYLADRTSTIRLGPAVVCAPYWHPIKLAGEAALFDHMSNGRLELGIGRGAFPYEFSRMADGIEPDAAREALAEMVPALHGLWDGNYEHQGKNWRFGNSTSCPRPLNGGHLPIWIAARNPDSFRIAVENKVDVMVNQLGLGIEELYSLNERRMAAAEEFGDGFVPRMMTLRSTHVGETEEEILMAAETYIEHRGHFDNLFDTDGDVNDGWVQFRDPRQYGEAAWSDTNLIRKNQMYDSAENMIGRLKEFEQIGTDVYLYLVPPRISREEQLESLRRFARDVMPAFAN
ncbi:LLM class flavin-dependent oxidoreductase [Arthrobacter sp. NPDC055138]